jgi:hypothetical protein
MIPETINDLQGCLVIPIMPNPDTHLVITAVEQPGKRQSGVIGPIVGNH